MAKIKNVCYNNIGLREIFIIVRFMARGRININEVFCIKKEFKMFDLEDIFGPPDYEFEFSVVYKGGKWEFIVEEKTKAKKVVFILINPTKNEILNQLHTNFSEIFSEFMLRIISEQLFREFVDDLQKRNNQN